MTDQRLNTTGTVMAEASHIPLDVEAKLHQLQQIIDEAKTVPLSSSVMINRPEVDGLLDEVRAALPDELTQARWVIRERDEILERAQADADRLVADARAESERLVSQQEVVRTAERNAARIVEEAREHGRQIRLEAEDYVDAKLANFEVVLTKTLTAVEKGRARLRGHLDEEDLSDAFSE